MSYQPEEVLEIAAELLGIEVRLLKSKTRTNIVAYRRHVVMWLLRHICRDLSGAPLAYEATGDMVNRDHSTTMHGIAMVQQRIDSDPSYAKLIRGYVTFITDKLEESKCDSPS